MKRTIVDLVRQQCDGDSSVKKTAARRQAIDQLRESNEGLDKLTPQMVSRWERAIDRVSSSSSRKKKKKKKKKREKENRNNQANGLIFFPPISSPNQEGVPR